MARKLRLEYPGACYHVINRGNYRRDVFLSERTKAAFVACLFEACEKSAWTLHAFVVMRNHYHLAVETPQGNLVAGMQWLQSTFANRFNKLRGERGHLFQGRYKALLVEAGDPLSLVCHYIHLNPVRAGIVAIGQLRTYRHSSYRYLWEPRSRPEFLRFDGTLWDVGALPDTRPGWVSYAAYLDWQAAEGPAGKSKAYVNLSRGWALGSADFKSCLLRDHAVAMETRAWESRGVAEVRELRWQAALAKALVTADRSSEEAARSPKSANWKLAIATWMKLRTQAPNGWIGRQLNLGAAACLSSNLTRYGRTQRATDPLFSQLTQIIAA